MPVSALTSLVHLVGFSTGIVLYAMLVVMTRREAVTARERGEASTPLPLIAAGLGLIWNTGSLVFNLMREFGGRQPTPWVVALSYGALGFLPAVIIHAASLTRPVAGRRALVRVAYGLSATAAVLFMVERGSGTIPARSALVTLTVGYVILLVAQLLGGERSVATRRHVTAIALAAFAVSALHLGHDASQPDAWYTALIGHHASIPLVLVILYQDYRFAFADLFLRRAIAIVLIVGVAAALHVLVATPLLATMQRGDEESLLATAGHIALWVGTALLYPAIYRLSSAFVDRVVLRRADYTVVRGDVITAIARAGSVEEATDNACRLVGMALASDPASVRWEATPDELGPLHPRVTLPERWRNTARVVVPTSERPGLLLHVGPLPAGRHLLSDEIALLEGVALVLARRVDVLRVARERHDRDLREREIMQLATESELRALRAQLNPHFLFNALNTLGYLMRAEPTRALQTLYRLTDLLRAVLRGPITERVPLGEELHIVEAYLEIERERFAERLTVVIDVPEELRAIRIPPLLLQPLVENAVKHGITPLRRGGRIEVRAGLLATGHLEVTVRDTGVGYREPSGPVSGLGLVSIRRRLEGLHGAAAEFSIEGSSDHGTVATIRLPIPRATPGASARRGVSAVAS